MYQHVNFKSRQAYLTLRTLHCARCIELCSKCQAARANVCAQAASPHATACMGRALLHTKSLTMPEHQYISALAQEYEYANGHCTCSKARGMGGLRPSCKQHMLSCSLRNAGATWSTVSCLNAAQLMHSSVRHVSDSSSDCAEAWFAKIL